MDAGVDPVKFWDYSPGEILDLIYSHERRRTQEARETVTRMFIHAQIVRRYMFPPEGDKNPPHPWEYYPDLFRKEMDEFTQYQQDEQAEKARNSRRAYAAEHNRRLEI